MSDDAQIHGRILGFDGAYALTVRDERGFLDNVQLHQGTIINPTGLTLAPGMVVSIIGYNAGPYFAANEIDTPYVYYGGVPYYQGHPWNYYGPSVSFGFYFGNGGWWHHDDFYGHYRYNGGVRVYDNVYVHNVYHDRGGSFHGRNYVAPPEHGGYYGHGPNEHWQGNRGEMRTYGGEHWGHGGEGHGDHGDHGDRGDHHDHGH